MTNYQIRTIQPGDDSALAKIIRDTLVEFSVPLKNTVYDDPTTDHLYELFKKEKSIYFVAESDGRIIGGAGIFPSDGLDAGTCELVKMYLVPAARGMGLGRILIDQCIEYAQQFGYKFIYLESMPELKKAISIYEKLGFEFLKAPLGDTKHYGCGVWMRKPL